MEWKHTGLMFGERGIETSHPLFLLTHYLLTALESASRMPKGPKLRQPSAIVLKRSNKFKHHKCFIRFKASLVHISQKRMLEGLSGLHPLIRILAYESLDKIDRLR